MKKPAPMKKTSGMGKTIKEYGGMEKYPSKSAMMKHEKKESMKTETSEGKSFKSKSSASLKSKFAATGAKFGMKIGKKKKAAVAKAAARTADMTPNPKGAEIARNKARADIQGIQSKSAVKPIEGSNVTEGCVNCAAAQYAAKRRKMTPAQRDIKKQALLEEIKRGSTKTKSTKNKK